MRIDVGAALFGAFDALGIDDRCGRTGLTRGSLAAFDAEGVLDAVQRSIPAPAIEIVVYCAARGQILGDCAPLAAGAEDVHQAVDHLAQVDRALIATRFGRWDQRSDLRPFFRPYVAPAIALDVRSRLGHVPYMFTVRGGFHGSALPFVRCGPLAQSGQGDADVRPGRRKRVPAPALARDGRQAGLPELRLPGLL